MNRNNSAKQYSNGYNRQVMPNKKSMGRNGTSTLPMSEKPKPKPKPKLKQKLAQPYKRFKGKVPFTPLRFRPGAQKFVTDPNTGHMYVTYNFNIVYPHAMENKKVRNKSRTNGVISLSSEHFYNRPRSRPNQKQLNSKENRLFLPHKMR
uniref:Uncharacterized protein n=1 Tax=viral metagenome TaxID=1070528 RepID=A0A6C0F5A7_9ZZZZ|tara:strand:- start:6524 stop:6970 length:447 start_codon:yes stop_codon:yes gene_type:complete